VTRLRLYEELRVSHIASQALKPQALGFKIYSNWPRPLYGSSCLAKHLGTFQICREPYRAICIPILMHVGTCSLNDPPPLESHLRLKIALLLGLSLRLFSIRTETSLSSIWILSLRSRLNGDFCFSATNFHHVSRHPPIIQLSSASRHSFISALQ
jgi:hypothetical protein